jgi:hypothetical protein
MTCGLKKAEQGPPCDLKFFQPLSTVDQAVTSEASLITGRGPCHDRERSQATETNTEDMILESLHER